MKFRFVPGVLTVFHLFTGAAWAQDAEVLSVDSEDLPRIPPTPVGEAQSQFQVREPFQIIPVAAEPLVMDPIAMDFDAQGRLFVVEMRGYSERRNEHLGRIRMLVDQDGDGVFDSATVYADGLAWPTAVICWKGGIFVGATPDILYLKDGDGDGVAEVRNVVFTGFASQVSRLNVQAMLNSFRWGIDNRIHGATGPNGGRVRRPEAPPSTAVDLRGRDFSFDPRRLDLRAESGGGQHGMTFDSKGRKFVCSNSHHLQQVMYEIRYDAINPYHALPAPAVDIPVDGPAAEVFRISPDEPWRVIRTRWRVDGLVPGPVEGGGRPSGYFTAATGVMVYEGDAWKAEFRGDAFIADAGSNLLHRKKLVPGGLQWSARRPADEQNREFLASPDNWFRPVQLGLGPDGNLYVLDMYREVIEHPWSLPEPIKKHLDLNSGNDRGRIYRIEHKDGNRRRFEPIHRANTAVLAGLLEHSNEWQRRTAAQLLLEREDGRAIPALESLLADSTVPEARIRALYLLNSLDGLQTVHLAKGLEDKHPSVRRHALRLVELGGRMPVPMPPDHRLRNPVRALAEDGDLEVRYQLAFTCGWIRHPDRLEILENLARNDHGDRWMREAILNSLPTGSAALFVRLEGDDELQERETGRELLKELAALAGRSESAAALEEWVMALVEESSADRFSEWMQAFSKGLQKSGRTLAQVTSTRIRRGVMERAWSVAWHGTSSSEARAAALGFAIRESSWSRLLKEAPGSKLNPSTPEEVHRSFLLSLGERSEAGAVEMILAHWNQWTPELKREALDVLLQRPENARRLLHSVQEDVVPTSVFTATQKQFLKQHPQGAIRGLASSIWPGEQEATPGKLDRILERKGDPAAGMEIFNARCASCHRLGESGVSLGPDMQSALASGPAALLASILHPNREVAPQYLNYQVETHDGKVLSGIIVQSTDRHITLRQAGGAEHVLERDRVRSLRSLDQSLMPEGLEEGLSVQDLADLIAALQEGANQRSPGKKP